MDYVRIFTGPDNLSHFADVHVDMKAAENSEAEPGTAGREKTALSEIFPTTGMVFRSSQPDNELDWHPTFRRAFLIVISGEMEITASDGEVRRFGPGSVTLNEDLTGKGHKGHLRSVAGQGPGWVNIPLA